MQRDNREISEEEQNRGEQSAIKTRLNNNLWKEKQVSNAKEKERENTMWMLILTPGDGAISTQIHWIWSQWRHRLINFNNLEINNKEWDIYSFPFDLFLWSCLAKNS